MVSSREDHMGCTPLHLAAKNGHLALVRRLLRAGADAEARDLLGFTALNSASMKNGMLLRNYANFIAPLKS
jgi:ankyrin repeat protein